MPLTGDYLRAHGLPSEPDPESYNELRDAINGLIADAADWLDANGPAEFLHLGTLAIRERYHCCVGKLFATDISRLDRLPDVGRGEHIPCFMEVALDPEALLTGEYVRAHGLPEVPDHVSYEELREAINGLIDEAADWLDENGPAKYLHLGSMALSAYGHCCVRALYVTDIRPLQVFPARDVHIPCRPVD